jgi:hypothetical protein
MFSSIIYLGVENASTRLKQFTVKLFQLNLDMEVLLQGWNNTHSTYIFTFQNRPSKICDIIDWQKHFLAKDVRMPSVTIEIRNVLNSNYPDTTNSCPRGYSTYTIGLPSLLTRGCQSRVYLSGIGRPGSNLGQIHIQVEMQKNLVPSSWSGDRLVLQWMNCACIIRHFYRWYWLKKPCQHRRSQPFVT